MVRIFNIEISSDYGWEIEVDGFEGAYPDYEDVEESPISIAICKKESGKIVAMYDPFVPKDEALKEMNKHDIFKEQCKFKHLKDDFIGDFIDALLYIEKQYVDDKLSKLEEFKNG